MGKTEVNNGKTLCLIQVGKVEKAKSLRDMVVPKTLANFLKRKTQLYEQGADVRRIGLYVRCWWRWVRAGVEIRQVSIDFCITVPKNPVQSGKR